MEVATREVLEDLIETVVDGHKGFEQVADRLQEDGHGEIAARMREFSSQRKRLESELREAASSNGVTFEEQGSVTAALHRGWIALADALTGDDPHAVLAAAEAGEDHALEAYENALAHRELPQEVRALIAKQVNEVRGAHDEVRNLRDTFA